MTLRSDLFCGSSYWDRSTGMNLLESRTELSRETMSSERFDTLFSLRAPDWKHATQAAQIEAQRQLQPPPTDRFSASRNNLIRGSQCMIIGSFGDKYAEGIKCSPKEKRPLGAGAGLIKHDFLPGVRGDAEKLQDMIRKDKDKELVYSLMDIPGVQETKQFYINYITKFFKECSKNGGL